jgi:hypothetical protein
MVDGFAIGTLLGICMISRKITALVNSTSTRETHLVEFNTS